MTQKKFVPVYAKPEVGDVIEDWKSIADSWAHDATPLRYLVLAFTFHGKDGKEDATHVQCRRIVDDMRLDDEVIELPYDKIISRTQVLSRAAYGTFNKDSTRYRLAREFVWVGPRSGELTQDNMLVRYIVALEQRVKELEERFEPHYRD